MVKKSNQDFCKALSNIKRASLIVCLSKPKNVTEILETCELSQSSLSQHLKVLRDSKIVKCQRNGKNQIYFLFDKRALEIAELLLRVN